MLSKKLILQNLIPIPKILYASVICSSIFESRLKFFNY